MKIYSKDDIKENLKLHDIVVFIVNTEVLEYEVKTRHLHNHDCGNNKILKLLNIENHKLFCKNIYGYEPDLGNFPEYHDGDYAAATRIVIALYDEIEKQSKSSKFKVEQKVNIEESIKDLSITGAIKNVDDYIHICAKDIDIKKCCISPLESNQKEEINLYKYTSDIKYI